MPDASWPNLPDYRQFSPADHAAHTTKRGTLSPEDMPELNLTSRKGAKQLMKIGSKPHLGQHRPKANAHRTKRKKRR